MDISSMVDRHLSYLVELRHRLHRIPELCYKEVKTAALIRGELDRLGIPHVAGVSGASTATVAWLGKPRGPCVALRADIDALPLTEATGAPYQSQHRGAMHACGHDGHAAILLGVAGALKAIENDLSVCVKLLWQPAEEGGGGAARLIEAGVLDGRIGPKVDAIFALHGWPGLKVGSIATRSGALLAAMDSFEVIVRGRGCHGAFPHLGRDPLVAACEMVITLQQIASREVDPTDSVVVTVGTINGGTAVNVIPDLATFTGTIRTLDPATRQQVRQAVQRRCDGVAAAHQCQVELKWTEGYPATINNPAMADYVARIARATLGAAAFVPVARPSMGSEDFSYYLEKVPGCFFMLGVEGPDQKSHPPLHTDHYDFGDQALPVGVRILLDLALHFSAGV